MRRIRTFSVGKGKYQEMFLDFRKNALPLSRKMNTSDPAMPVPLGHLIDNNLS